MTDEVRAFFRSPFTAFAHADKACLRVGNREMADLLFRADFVAFLLVCMVYMRSIVHHNDRSPAYTSQMTPHTHTMSPPALSEEEAPANSIKNFFSRVTADKYHADRKLKHEETKEIRELKRMRAKEDERVLKEAAREKETKRKRVYRAKVRLAEGAGVAIEVHDNHHKGVREFSHCRMIGLVSWFTKLFVVKREGETSRETLSKIKDRS